MTERPHPSHRTCQVTSGPGTRFGFESGRLAENCVAHPRPPCSSSRVLAFSRPPGRTSRHPGVLIFMRGPVVGPCESQGGRERYSSSDFHPRPCKGGLLPDLSAKTSRCDACRRLRSPVRSRKLPHASRPAARPPQGTASSKLPINSISNAPVRPFIPALTGGNGGARPRSLKSSQ